MSDDEETDPDLPDESDMDDDEQPDLMPCPHCRQMILEDAVYCHHCRKNVSDYADRASTRSLVVVIIICALVVLGMLGWLMGR